MDQIELYQKLQSDINQKEHSMNKEFKTLEKKLTTLLEGYYDKNITHEQRKQLDKLKRDIDREISQLYKQLNEKMKGQRQEIFDLTIFSYAYMFHLFLSGKELFPLSANTPQAKAVQGMLTARNKMKEEQKKDKESTRILQKHKNHFVSSLYGEITKNLKLKRGFDEMKKKITERTSVAKSFAINKLSDWLHQSVGKAQDTVFKVAKGLGAEKLWASMRDNQVRSAHRTLDGKKADSNGYFHYKGDKADRPKKWKDSSMNWGCRCKVMFKLNGKLPKTSKVKDYRDNAYNEKLQKKIDEHMKNGDTLIQATNKAQREIQPPVRTVPYVSYSDWLSEFGPNQ